MNREQLKRAADVNGRLEAFEAALKDLERIPHGALCISLPSMSEDGEFNETGIKAFYSRELYEAFLLDLIDVERGVLRGFLVRVDAL